VRVDPIKPTLKAPGPQRLKLEFDGLLSISAFKFKLRRYNSGTNYQMSHATFHSLNTANYEELHTALLREEALYSVGRCSLTLSNPR
jgi:hypothetical protein